MKKTPSRLVLLLALTPLTLAGACKKAQKSTPVAMHVTTPAAARPAAPAPAPAAAPSAPAAAATQPGAALVTTKDELPTISAADLVKEIKGKDKPLLFHVGFPKLYEQAHIPGSEYIAPGMIPAGIARLQQRVAKLPHDTAIVLYCGCCPWSHCPNVLPAYQALQRLGFTHVKVLYIPYDFGTDWVAHGYPTASGS